MCCSQMRASGAAVILESGPSAIPSARVAPGPGTGSRPRAVSVADVSTPGSRLAIRRRRLAAACARPSTPRSGKPAIAMSRAVFRPRVSEAANHPRRFVPCDGWVPSERLDGAGATAYERSRRVPGRRAAAGGWAGSPSPASRPPARALSRQGATASAPKVSTLLRWLNAHECCGRHVISARSPTSVGQPRCVDGSNGERESLLAANRHRLLFLVNGGHDYDPPFLHG